MRVAARRGKTVDGSTLVGCSILVLEEQPFVACCLRLVLEGAGAQVHNAASADHALHLIARTGLSAAVLSCSKTTKGRRRIAQRLARLNLPFVLCKDIDQRDMFPGTPALITPVIGVQLVEMLHGLIVAGNKTDADRATLGQSARRSNLNLGERHRVAETPS